MTVHVISLKRDCNFSCLAYLENNCLDISTYGSFRQKNKIKKKKKKKMRGKHRVEDCVHALTRDHVCVRSCSLCSSPRLIERAFRHNTKVGPGRTDRAVSSVGNTSRMGKRNLVSAEVERGGRLDLSFRCPLRKGKTRQACESIVRAQVTIVGNSHPGGRFGTSDLKWMPPVFTSGSGEVARECCGTECRAQLHLLFRFSYLLSFLSVNRWRGGGCDITANRQNGVSTLRT